MSAELLELHARRVVAYNSWHEAFRVYLVDEQERVYDVYVQRVIADFNAINDALRALALPDHLRALRSRLLEHEARKMRLTVEMQLAQKAHFIDALRRELVEESLADADSPGRPAAHRHHDGCGHGHDAAPLVLATKARPTEEDSTPMHSFFDQQRQPRQNDAYDRQVAAIQAQLSAVIEEINDIIDEVRYDE